MATPNQFIGSKVSLTSKAEIRYEGILYSLDLVESTISLAKVKSYGTEDRPTDRPIPPKDEIYEFIIFRGSDIKAVDVVDPPVPPSTSSGLTNDPAIVEISHYHSQSQPNQHSTQAGSSSSFGQQKFGYPTRSESEDGVVDGEYAKPWTGHPSRGPTPTRQDDQNGQNKQGQRQRQGKRRQQQGQGQQQRQSQGNNGGNSVMQGQRTYNRGGRGGYTRQPFQSQRGNNNQQRGGYTRARPEKEKFDKEFDFEKANEELSQVFEKIKLEDDNEPKANADAEANGTGEEVVYYQRDKFFDNISCEAMENQGRGRPDWRAERKMNSETFGTHFRAGGGRGGYNRYQRFNGRGYRGTRGYYGGYNNGYQNQNFNRQGRQQQAQGQGQQEGTF